MPFIAVTSEMYFLTSTVVEWIELFSRPQYRHIIIDSLKYCQKEKGLLIYAWVLMPNHIHMIASSKGDCTVSDIMRDFKKYTSKRIIEAIKQNSQESRKEWLLNKFSLASCVSGKMGRYKIWQDGCYSELISSGKFLNQKIEYLHNNPVRQEIVFKPEEYLYSSAVDYAGGKGVIDVELI